MCTWWKQMWECPNLFLNPKGVPSLFIVYSYHLKSRDGRCFKVTYHSAVTVPGYLLICKTLHSSHSRNIWDGGRGDGGQRPWKPNSAAKLVAHNTPSCCNLLIEILLNLFMWALTPTQLWLVRIFPAVLIDECLFDCQVAAQMTAGRWWKIILMQWRRRMWKSFLLADAGVQLEMYRFLPSKH